MALQSVFSPLVQATVTVDLGAAAANTTTELTVEVLGARPNHPVLVRADDLDAGLVISHAWCSDLDEVTIRFGNLTGSSIDPAEQDLDFLIL